ncbi:MAG: Maf family nucleotide pyrophosphatase [Bacteroidales bacterium]|jgi:septum formation protein
MLRDKLKGFDIILASASPRRKQLLEGIDLDFTIENGGDIEEIFDPTMNVKLVPEYLAELKSKEFARALKDNEILITADTMVLCDNEILGKPLDRQDAVGMLSKLSGKKHQVLTGVFIRNNFKSGSFTAITDVYFRDLSVKEIEFYVDKYRPYDKAGAYGAQEWIGYIAISRIEGSYFNVMGLPVQRLYLELDKFLTD